MLSIIIPFYKLKFFEETLESLANQTDKRFKVYIGDDASPDDCTSLLDQFKNKFDFTYHRFESNLGGISLTQHWERCIALNEDKEWLMILGDDDVLGENVVEEFHKQSLIFEINSNVIRFAKQTISDKSLFLGLIQTYEIWEDAFDSFYNRVIGKTTNTLSEYVFNRKVYEKYRFYPYPVGWHSDDRAWLDFSDDKPIFSINDAVVYVRLSDLNISGKKDNLTEKMEAQYKFFSFIMNEKFSSFSKHQKSAILIKYERVVFNQPRIKISDYLSLLGFYLMRFKIRSVLRVFKRTIKRFP